MKQTHNINIVIEKDGEFHEFQKEGWAYERCIPVLDRIFKKYNIISAVDFGTFLPTPSTNRRSL